MTPEPRLSDKQLSAMMGETNDAILAWESARDHSTGLQQLALLAGIEALREVRETLRALTTDNGKRS